MIPTMSFIISGIDNEKESFSEVVALAQCHFLISCEKSVSYAEPQRPDHFQAGPLA
jgi:hypothetical protein